MVSVITCTMRQKNIRNVFKNYKHQNFKEKELIIVLNEDDMSIRKWKKRAARHHDVTVYQLSERLTLGDCLNFAIEKSRYAIIAKFDDDDYYAPGYLTQSVQALIDHGADVVGKSELFTYMAGLKALVVRKWNFIAGATLVFKKEVWMKVKFPGVKRGSDTAFKEGSIKHGFKIHHTDKYNFCLVRMANPQEHTWIISNRAFLRHCSIISYTEHFKPLVVTSD